MKKFLLLGVMVMFVGLSTDALGQRRYNERGDRRRIQRGVRSGQLTRDEARALRERQRQIRAERRAARADGVVTREERRDIRRDEREHDRMIRNERRDNDRRNVNGRRNHRRGDGYYRRGAGSPTHPVFGTRSRNRNRNRNW